MSEVKKAIEEITHLSDLFPKDAFQVITDNREEALPYLRKAIDDAISKGKMLEGDNQLHFYALYLLGEFQDRESFPKIMELVTLKDDTAEYLLGDCITTELRDILYNTYDGNIELLKKSIRDRDIDEFVRSVLLDVMGQLYLDGSLEENAWKDFLRQEVYDGREYDFVYNSIGYILCKCHFVDMLPDIRYMFDNDLIDEMCMGKYDSYVDAMFEYREDEDRFCEKSFCAAEALRHWAMFSESEERMPEEKDFEKLIRMLEKEESKSVRKTKVGRNDPCPCGSGKKYKYCCLNKPKDAMDSIETPEERSKWLKRYPYTGKEKVEGRIYLEDFYDEVSIETDKMLYLALMNRPGLIWKRNVEQEGKRAKEYLYLAFQKCRERMEEEQLASFTEYNKKYSIHYQCEEWLGELCRLLQESRDVEKYEEVKKFIAGKQRMVS